jgi:hypothetical protein
MAANRTAQYKGKTYRLLFSGPTKYGRRARLQFTDGTKDFWVDASLVTEGAAPAAGSTGGAPSPRGSLRGKRTGCSCGSIEGEYHPWYCESCRFDELDQ